jgi:hypothetical protein
VEPSPTEQAASNRCGGLCGPPKGQPPCRPPAGVGDGSAGPIGVNDDEVIEATAIDRHCSWSWTARAEELPFPKGPWPSSVSS